jgi:hypothetical protein
MTGPKSFVPRFIDRVTNKARRIAWAALGVDRNPPIPSQPNRYEHMLGLFREQNPVAMIEIGVWRGDQSLQFLTQGKALKRYVGFDLFEGMTGEVFKAESMGNCVPHSEAWVMQRLKPIAQHRGCSVELVAGPTERTLTRYAAEHPAQFDFIYIDGGHSLETVENDWKASEQLLAPGGLIVLDDYYLNDATRGARPLVDRLIVNPGYVVRFLPVNEDIVEDLQITMVAVRRR